jgi:tRNA(Ile2) C34 agmatinyltransferase TiaS
MENKITGFSLDKSTKKIKPIFDKFNIEEINLIYNKRFEFCKNCRNYVDSDKEGRPKRCRLCGCSLQFKLSLIYPLDNNGKAIRHIDPSGEIMYVCPLIKW